MFNLLEVFYAGNIKTHISDFITKHTGLLTCILLFT